MSENNPLVGAVTVGTSAVLLAVGSTSRPGRKKLHVYNNSDTTIYVGPSGVTTSTGRPVLPNEELEWFSTDDLYAIAGTTGNDVRVTETI